MLFVFFHWFGVFVVDIMLVMIPVALLTGLGWLFVFLWSMKSGQLDDLDGASHRALFAEDDGVVLVKSKDNVFNDNGNLNE